MKLIKVSAAIDWLSVKLNSPCVVLLFIDVDIMLKALGGAAAVTTILYNAVRIYKEFKNKK